MFLKLSGRMFAILACLVISVFFLTDLVLNYANYSLLGGVALAIVSVVFFILHCRLCWKYLYFYAVVFLWSLLCAILFVAVINSVYTSSLMPLISESSNFDFNQFINDKVAIESILKGAYLLLLCSCVISFIFFSCLAEIYDESDTNNNHLLDFCVNMAIKMNALAWCAMVAYLSVLAISSSLFIVIDGEIIPSKLFFLALGVISFLASSKSTTLKGYLECFMYILMLVLVLVSLVFFVLFALAGVKNMALVLGVVGVILLVFAIMSLFKDKKLCLDMSPFVFNERN
ncbi:MAG TPA: hypothetical protein DCL21_03410 [Alphaproteobacteria bacterium]|nr:hypothetical protein [Alphaproteobacteria bacterium]